MNSDFALHPQLEKDSRFVYRLNLSDVRIIDDANYPWFLLIPRRPNLAELHQLNEDEQQLLTNESRLLSQAIEQCFSPDKLNVAAIGNVVPQLHVHHIARYKADIAWPKPVWGFAPLLSYEDTQLQARIGVLSECLTHMQNKH